jgi:hypothetical protein
MSDPTVLQRGVIDSPITFQRFLDDPPVTPLDITGLEMRAAFRVWEDRYGTESVALLELDSATDAELAIDVNPTIGKVSLALTVAQKVLLNPDNLVVQIAVGMELYDPADAQVLVYPFLQEHQIEIQPEIPR